MSRSLKDQLIEQALKAIKVAVKQKRVSFIDREKNRDCLAELGFVMSDVYSLIQKLSISNYHKGPEVDLNGSSGDVWVFLLPIQDLSCPLYLKLKLLVKGDLDFVVIISFHK